MAEFQHGRPFRRTLFTPGEYDGPLDPNASAIVVRGQVVFEDLILSGQSTIIDTIITYSSAVWVLKCRIFGNYLVYPYQDLLKANKSTVEMYYNPHSSKLSQYAVNGDRIRHGLDLIIDNSSAMLNFINSTDYDILVTLARTTVMT